MPKPAPSSAAFEDAPLFETVAGAEESSRPPVLAVGESSIWSSLPAFAEETVARSRASDGDVSEVRRAALRARDEAYSRLEVARAEAAQIVAAARRDAEIVRQDALVEGFSAGLKNAYGEVEAELGEKFEARCAAVRAGVDEIVQAVLAEREAAWRGMETEIIDVAMEIARKVVKEEVALNPAVVERVVKDALRRVSDRSSLRILVNPDDLQHVRDNREEILHAIDGVQGLVIDGDRRVGPGGCVIETAGGSIDAKIETQLDQAEAALRG